MKKGRLSKDEKLFIGQNVSSMQPEDIANKLNRSLALVKSFIDGLPDSVSRAKPTIDHIFRGNTPDVINTPQGLPIGVVATTASEQAADDAKLTGSKNFPHVFRPRPV